MRPAGSWFDWIDSVYEFVSCVDCKHQMCRAAARNAGRMAEVVKNSGSEDFRGMWALTRKEP